MYVYVFVIHEVYNCCCCGPRESHTDVLMHVLRYMWYICCSCMYFLFSILPIRSCLTLHSIAVRVAFECGTSSSLSHSNTHARALHSVAIKLYRFHFHFLDDFPTLHTPYVTWKISTKSYMNRFVYYECIHECMRFKYLCVCIVFMCMHE